MRRGFSLIELLIVVSIVLIIIMVAVPQYHQAQILAREMAASKAVQTIQTGEIMYQSAYGRYAQSRRELGPPDTGASNASSAGPISGSLASGTVGGYRFTVSAGAEGFAIGAAPVVYRMSGVRSFYLDQSGIMRFSGGSDPATATSPEFAG